jgi:hypothetical protein
MPEAKAREQTPSIGRIVIYRTREGVDVPAIITYVIDGDRGDVHLQPFVPPGVAPDTISYQWGVPCETADRVNVFDEDGHSRTAWRWPDRV